MPLHKFSLLFIWLKQKQGKHKRSESITSRSTIPLKKDDKELCKTYIATQGCLPNTIIDFWSMIWQENTRVIVMTTKELERGKTKCARYWPDQGQTREWGPAKVTCQTENSTSDYTLREFLFSWKNKEERRIYQFHFQVWPDHGVPSDPGCVLNFLHDVNARQDSIRSDGINPVSIFIFFAPFAFLNIFKNRENFKIFKIIK